MPGFDFLRDALGAPPPVTAEQARRLLRERFGLDLTPVPLGSQQDTNFLLHDGDEPHSVLKIAHPAFGTEEIAAQDAAAELLARAGLRAATPRSEPVTVDGRVARLLTYLPGASRNDGAYAAPDVLAATGRLVGRVSVALAGFDHPGLERTLQWDMRHAAAVVARLGVPAAFRSRVEDATGEAWAALPPDLPTQAVHLDLTGDNIVRTGRVPDGVLDFGDLTRTWAVCEVAVTCAEALHRAGAEPATVLPIVAGFHAVRPLADAEMDALWPLVVLRAAILVVGGHHQVALDPANAYAADGLDAEWRIFEQATSVPLPVMTALLRHALGRPVPTLVATGRAVAGPVTPLDLAPAADAMDEGAWLDADLPDRLAAALPGTVATRWAQPRPGPPLSATSPATVPTGVDVWTDEPVRAPWPGLLTEEAGGRRVLRGETAELVITPRPTERTALSFVSSDRECRSFAAGGGARVAPGDVLVHASRVHLLLRAAGAPDVPALVRPEYAPGWLALTADPLGGDPIPASTSADLLRRRAATLAGVQEHYYADPPLIERGWRHHLVADDGRAYLDMVNNVTVLGHAHPGVERAVTRRLRRLNTNSRFHYRVVVEFAERLAALLPDPLDTVFLVNSGSEAVDLALRLALAATGRPDVVALREAYHGWTYLTDAVSTSVADNPNALATRPSWVHTVDAPYRDPGRSGPEAVAVIDALAAAGRPPAAFVAETFCGNAGGIALPDGYLRQVYAAVRRHGGLAVADEVQAGYGRLGRWFWGFEQQGAVPDVAACAKAMGNGHPLGAVVTSRAVADRYRAGGYFFSSTGGSPVSCAVGLAVLDALRDEDLQAKAARVGAHLKAELEALRHPVIRAVHGEGLYLGVEFALDRADTALICERLRTLGVIMQPTGDDLNVLKIKPPLCVDEAAADFFVAMLDRALTEGW